MKKVTFYDPNLSMEELCAMNNGVTPQAIRKYAKKHFGISYKDDKTYRLWKKVHALLDSTERKYTVTEIADILHKSPVTIRHYKNMSEPPTGIIMLNRYNDVVAYRKDHPAASIQEIAEALKLEKDLVKRFLNLEREPEVWASMQKEEEMVAHIKSLTSDLRELLMNILRLHIKASTFDCELTYGHGSFYSKTGIPKPENKYDKHPLNPKTINDLDAFYETIEGDCAMFNSVMIDLPEFIAKNGFQEGNSANPCPGRKSFESETILLKEYKKMMDLAYRVLYPGGVLVFTATDIPFKDHMVWTSFKAQKLAAERGFEHIDTFILDKTPDMKPLRRQMATHSARIAQKYFFVFRKPNLINLF